MIIGRESKAGKKGSDLGNEILLEDIQMPSTTLRHRSHFAGIDDRIVGKLAHQSNVPFSSSL